MGKERQKEMKEENSGNDTQRERKEENKLIEG